MAENVSKVSQKPEIQWRGKQRQIFEYIINLDVKSLKVDAIAEHVGLGKRQTYRYLTHELWKEALAFRRSQYAKLAITVDMGLAKKAAKGDAAASKLFYQRFEGWKEPKSPMELTGKGGGPLKMGLTMADGIKQVRDQMKSNPEEEERLLREVMDE